MLVVVVPIVVVDIRAVEIVVAVHVDVHVRAMPIAAAPERRPHRDPHTKRDGRAGDHVAGRVVVVGRVHGVGPDAVDHRGVVGGHVDHLGARGLDDDGLRLAARGLVLHLDGLLVVALEVARRLGLLAQHLHGVHHVLLLGEERVAEIRRPGQLLVHHGEHLGKSRQGLHAGVPILLLHGVLEFVPLEPGVVLDPARRLDDLDGVGRRHQDLGEQRIRVERNRRHQLLKFFGARGFVIGTRRTRGGRLAGGFPLNG